MAENQRNAEIWSTRLQKELLALTTDNASEKETQEVAGILPDFVVVKTHELDIENGVCKIQFIMNIDGPTTTTEGEEESSKEEIVVTLDTSLTKKPDGIIDPAAPAYPFLIPKVVLTTGASRFPPASTVENGNVIDLDCDWTPSLHLTDAVLNIGLKIKESISQGEPLNATSPKEPMDDFMKGARKFSQFITQSARSFVDKPKSRRKKKDVKKKATATNINIGDEINLLEAPWVDCQGLYSCKAIRRPTFVEDAIALAQAQGQPEQQGFGGAAGMLRSFTQSAKSVLEESFLMITETHIVELRSSKLNLSTGTVTFAISIELMAKLKFRRQESISLFFKPAPDDPLIFMCPDSADAVHQIQNVLKGHGVKGKHTNAATQKAIHEALQLVQEIQAKERALEYQPSVERVNEIMDLYRQAAERFEVAGDPRHEEVVVHMRKFLAMPLTTSILDGSFKPTIVESSTEKDPEAIPQGEVLERTKEQLEDYDEGPGVAISEDKAFEQNIDSMLEEAKKDFDSMNIETDGIDLFDNDNDDSLSDIDAMLSAADKELSDIMAS
mmetsp:Transcript_23129/g.33138  ORF Transcript_23129/g.33138 Transcript_23129/m.33138 type:complete len:556 (-) Transcript_23129:1080-2747(-)|eukprot:CAMPEP_0202470692 /NCGR_PEP_ID=MMETSP1360-20130828/82316_1 /ASSEMBLY_ACC=CAM_ASM_000848 /TAXON_ID=515479 /ORGANISM="Licmophora paradoxa, Strain CCMP2313" /LENGTH=555 /DNA_ID=CAMNT_0049096475 /DNA_START=3 /DNA_END=1670 /DNA_ORIENTATION=-